MPLARHDDFVILYNFTKSISTHMPLARHDIIVRNRRHQHIDFYSHASCEAWQILNISTWLLQNFYSHASCEAWRSTRSIVPASPSNFYSHASCEAWRCIFLQSPGKWHFYSHASCEAWPNCRWITRKEQTFLLTCLLRGMTPATRLAAMPLSISTHMPLARHDIQTTTTART